MQMTTTFTTARPLGLALLLAAAAMLTACAGTMSSAGKPAAAPSLQSAADTGAGADEQFNSAAQALDDFYKQQREQQAKTLAEANERANRPVGPRPVPPGSGSGSKTNKAANDPPSPKLVLEAKGVPTETDLAANTPTRVIGVAPERETAPPVEAALTPTQKTRRALNDLLETTGQPGAARGQAGALKPAVRLALIEALATTLGASPEDAALRRAAEAKIDSLRASLPPADAAAHAALRTLLRETLTRDDSAGGASALAGAFERAAAESSTTLGLSMPAVQLCTKVESLGRYSPITTDNLLAGKPLTTLVYTEVANFAHSTLPAARGSGGDPMLVSASADATAYTVALSQELALYAADGTQVWSRPKQTVRETSRVRRRDYYLVQRVEIPANVLYAGAYTLKVTLRDEIANATVEQTVPITFVADRQTRGNKPVTRRSDLE